MIILEAFGTFKSWHYWPGASKKGYSALEQPHWHNFHVRVRLLVGRDREVEFIEFGQHCAGWLSAHLAECRSLSCESMAQHLLAYLEDYYKVIPLSVHVAEDGLSGAIAVSKGRLADVLAVF